MISKKVIMYIILGLISTPCVVGSIDVKVTSNNLICDHIAEFDSVIYNTSIDHDLYGVLFFINWTYIESDLALKLIMPNGMKIDQTVTSSTILHEKKRDNACEYYFVLNPPKGNWSIEITSLSVPKKGEEYCMQLSYVNSTLILGDAKLNGIVKYDAKDRDLDGLDDQINVDVGVNVKTPGRYIVNGTLYYDKKTGSLTASNNSYLTQGTKFLTLHFTGMRAFGPYQLNLTLYDEHSNEILDHIGKEYLILIYKNIDVNFPLAKLTRHFLDYGEDVNGDGKKEVLTIDVGINVIVPGNYALQGYLYDLKGSEYDLKGSEIAWSIDNSFFDIGLHTMHLNFDGSTIEKKKLNGPYKLSKLILTTRNWTVMDAASDAYITQPYSYSDFPSKSTDGTVDQKQAKVYN